MMNKLVFNNLNVDKFYFNNKNINKLYLGKNLIYNNEVPEVPEVSDLVELGILSKQISEFTNDDIGTIISIPYNDESGKILLNNRCIEFEVVGVNHHKDINDESKSTITLMTKNIIRYVAFDAKEPTNTDYNRAEYGNNRWSVSNIRQWLNSNGAANEWFTTQHQHDAEPNTTNVDYTPSGAYANYPGFLAGFSDEVKQHFATIRNKTILCNVDKLALSKDFEETEDKVFLPSFTEMGFGNLDSSNPEGSHITKFNSDESRAKSGAPGYYWMRTPDIDYSYWVCYVYGDGYSGIYNAAHGGRGVAPLLVLC